MLRIAMAAATPLWLAGAARAQQQPPAAAPPPPDFSKVEIKTTNLGDNVYMLEGQGGNITVALAKDGIIMVDSEFAPLHDKIKAAISAVSNQPIKYLIDTHFHAAGTGGRTAHEDLHRRLQDQAQRPRRRSHPYRQCAHRRRHLCVVQDRRCALDRRYLHQWPLSQHRFRQWGKHQGMI